jgi:triphosphatase
MKPVQNKTAGPIKATPVQLAGCDSAAGALRAIVDHCMAHIQANATALRAGGDAGHVRQMRIGLRRLKSALGLFAPLAPCPPVLKRELDWLLGRLGSARDWDVLAGTTLVRLTQQLPLADLTPLRQAATDAAAKRQQQAQAAVASRRYARLLRALAQWHPHTDLPLRAFADQALRRLYRTLRRRARHTDDAAQRHRVRLAAKRLRYGFGFFSALYPPEPAHRFARRLARLQDALGWLNDAAVARHLLRRLARQEPDLAAGAKLARDTLRDEAEAGAQLGALIGTVMRQQPPFGKE